MLGWICFLIFFFFKLLALASSPRLHPSHFTISFQESAWRYTCMLPTHLSWFVSLLPCFYKYAGVDCVKTGSWSTCAKVLPLNPHRLHRPPLVMTPNHVCRNGTALVFTNISCCLEHFGLRVFYFTSLIVFTTNENLNVTDRNILQDLALLAAHWCALW